MTGAGQVSGVRPPLEVPQNAETAPPAAAASAAPVDPPGEAPAAPPAAPPAGAPPGEPTAPAETTTAAGPTAAADRPAETADVGPRAEVDVLDAGPGPSLLSAGADTLSVSPGLRTSPFLTGLTPITSSALLSASFSFEGTGAADFGYPLLPTFSTNSPTGFSMVGPLQSFELLDVPPQLRLSQSSSPFSLGPTGGSTHPQLGLSLGTPDFRSGGVSLRPGVGRPGPWRVGAPGVGPAPRAGDASAPARIRPMRRPDDLIVTMEVSGQAAAREIFERQRSFYADLPPPADAREAMLDQIADELVSDVITSASIGRGRWALAAQQLGVEVNDENRREVADAALALSERVRVHDPNIERRYAIMAGLLQVEEARLAELRAGGASEDEIADSELKIAALEGRMDDTIPLLRDENGQPIAYPDDVYGPPAPGQYFASDIREQTEVTEDGNLRIGDTEIRTAGLGRMMSTVVATRPDGTRDEPQAQAAHPSMQVLAQTSRSFNGRYRSDVRDLLDQKAAGYISPVGTKPASPSNVSVLGRQDAVELVAETAGVDEAAAAEAVTAALEQALVDYMQARNGVGRSFEQQAEDVERALDNLVHQVRFAVNRTLTRADTGRTPVAETPLIGSDYRMG